MTWPCTDNGLNCVLERLRRAHAAAEGYRMTHTIAVVPAVDREQARRFHRIYPDRHPPSHNDAYQRDLRLARRYMEEAARELGQLQLERMEDVLRQARDRYQRGRQREQALTSLAHGIRAWLPFVSYAPFIILNEPADQQQWQNAVPQGPAQPDQPPPLPAAPDDEDMDDQVDGSWQGERQHQRQAEETIHREVAEARRFVHWRSLDRTPEANDPRRMAMISMGVDSSAALREHLYRQFPILLLFRHPIEPRHLVALLRQPTAQRNRLLREMIEVLTQPLQTAINRYRRTLRGDDGQPQWQKLRPVTYGAKLLLLPENEPANSPLNALFDEFIEDMEPFTFQDWVLWGSVAATVLLVIASAGTALPAAAATAMAVGIDAAAVGLTTYRNHLDNVDQRQMNRFSDVDAALHVASPPVNLATDMIITALSYLIPYAGGAAVRLARRSLVRRISRRVLGRAAARSATQRGGAASRGLRQGGSGASMIDDAARGARSAASRGLASATSRSQRRAALDALDREIDEMIEATMRGGGEAAQGSVPELSSFVVNNQQRQTLGRILGRTLDRNQARTVTLARDAEHAAAMEASAARMGRRSPQLLQREMQQAEERAASILRRIRAHWDAALPPGFSSRNQVVESILQRFWQVMPDRPNQWIRARLFGNWRQRAMRRIGQDGDLMRDLREQAGIIVAHRPGSGRYSFRLRTRTPDGRTVHTWLDLDHANTGHADAVIDAYENNSAQHLISTIASDNLQLLTARENQVYIEALRRIQRRIAELQAQMTATGSAAAATIES